MQVAGVSWDGVFHLSRSGLKYRACKGRPAASSSRSGRGVTWSVPVGVRQRGRHHFVEGGGENVGEACCVRCWGEGGGGDGRRGQGATFGVRVRFGGAELRACEHEFYLRDGGRSDGNKRMERREGVRGGRGGAGHFDGGYGAARVHVVHLREGGGRGQVSAAGCKAAAASGRACTVTRDDSGGAAGRGTAPPPLATAACGGAADIDRVQTEKY